jgi:hypothetical protein
MLSLLLLSSLTQLTDSQRLSPWWTQELASESLVGPEAVVGKIDGYWRRETRVLLNSTGFVLTRPFPDPKAWPCIVNEMKLDSGETVTIVIPEFGGRLNSSFTGNVLLLGRRPVNDEEGRPLIEFSSGQGSRNQAMRFVAKETNEVGGLLLLPTRESAKSPGPSLDDRLEAILETVDPSDSTSYRRVSKLLCRAHPMWTPHPNPRWDGPGNRSVSPTIEAADNPRLAATFSRLRSEVKNDYQRSHLLGLQIRWRIPGALLDYCASIIRLLEDPNAYVGPDEGYLVWGLVDFSAHPNLWLESRRWEYDTIDAWCSDLESARNSVLRLYWLMNALGVPYPTNERMGRFAQLLRSHDREFKYLVMARLANWTATPDKMPQKDGFVDGKHVEFPNFEEVLTYWKKRYDIRG